MGLSIDRNIQEIPFYPKAAKYGLDEGWARLASNENPFPPSPKALSAILDALLSVNRYPGNDLDLRTIISGKYGLKPENVVLGDGSDELIEIVLRAMKHRERNRVIISEPSFAFYAIASKIYGYETVKVPVVDMKVDLLTLSRAVDERTRVIFLNNPLNPTGTIFENDPFRAFLEAIPSDILVVVDEAYGEFAESRAFPGSYRYIDQFPVLTLRTFSKAYALAGLRIGYGIGEVSLVSFLERTKQPFSVNTAALVGAKEAMLDEEYLKKVLVNNQKGKKFLYNAFTQMSIEYVPTEANFILFKVGKEAETLSRKLFDEKILVRWMGAYGLPEYVRVSVGRAEENERFAEALKKILQ